jgi:hypothetical protein
MLVPMYADIDGRIARLGSVRITGNSTLDAIQMLLPAKPKRLMIITHHDVLEM